MSLTAVVTIGGIRQGSGTLTAFVGSVVRGVQNVTSTPPFGPYVGVALFQMILYADAGGETVSFRFDDGEATTAMAETLVFTVNGNVGTVLEPFELTGALQSPSPPPLVDCSTAPPICSTCAEFLVGGAALPAACEGCGPYLACDFSPPSPSPLPLPPSPPPLPSPSPRLPCSVFDVSGYSCEEADYGSVPFQINQQYSYWGISGENKPIYSGVNDSSVFLYYTADCGNLDNINGWVRHSIRRSIGLMRPVEPP